MLANFDITERRVSRVFDVQAIRSGSRNEGAICWNVRPVKYI